jgi:hypothetical protein
MDATKARPLAAVQRQQIAQMRVFLNAIMGHAKKLMPNTAAIVKKIKMKQISTAAAMTAPNVKPAKAAK